MEEVWGREERGWSHSEARWSVWSGKAAGGLDHHLLPKPSFPRQGGGKRKDQGQYQALVKERSCGHLGLGLHHSFLLPDPATQMLSGGISTLSPDDPRALGPCWWLGFLTNSAATHLSSSHHHWPWPCMCWCLFPPTRTPLLGSMKLSPGPGVKSRLVRGEGWS